MAIGAHYSSILALLQSLPGAASPALAQAAAAPPVSPLRAILLGTAAAGIDTHLGQSIDVLA
ncbi:hypothetical protein R5W23_001396 [Gemmata sp. JC673]|uniref:Uncharacterized protein n=1 Tax=Gemmata algarum TaxID=2975278 RepID=A0ABU5F2L3_9BACT|nr:hypothetical protein [Gemmata algarum]MDY3560171.1 hypothetical protein [Gemmata algarum]